MKWPSLFAKNGEKNLLAEIKNLLGLTPIVEIRKWEMKI